MNLSFSKTTYYTIYTLLACLLYILPVRASFVSNLPQEVALTIANNNYKSEYAYNLNIVYLVPSDGDTLPGFRQRISELMLWAQKSTEDAMTKHGYPSKTFGLLVNHSQEVKIQVIRSAYCYGDLTYEGTSGASRAQQEVTSFYEQFPGEKASLHTLILYPSELKEDGIHAVASTPFYGIGNFGHALDYPLLSLKNIQTGGIIGNEARNWFGGMIHEMFHALSLPHNTLPSHETGTALMRFHGRLGRDPIILTAADASILNVNQICSKIEGIYYTPSECQLEVNPPVYKPTSKSILLKGQLTFPQSVDCVLIYIDPYEESDHKIGPPGAPNTDYDAVSFVVRPHRNTFEIEIPINALRNFKTDIDHYIRINLLHQNGFQSKNVYTSSFRFMTDKTPNIEPNNYLYDADF